MSEATQAPRPRLQTHIVSTYELISSYASLSNSSHASAASPASASASSSVPSLNELAKLQQELVNVRDDLANRKAQLRSEDDKARNYAKSVSKTKGKDKERPSQPSSQKHPNLQKQQQQQQQSQADEAHLKAINKTSRDQMRSSSADLSDAEVTVKRKKDPNKKRKRRPEIPLDSEDEYSDAPTPPTQLQSSLDSNQTDHSQHQQQIKSRKTMPPPASAHAAGTPNAAAGAPPLSRANSLSDISSAATPAAAAASATAKAHQQQSQRQDSPAQGSSLKVKLNGFKKEKSETPALATTAPSPPKRQPAPVGSAEDFSLPKKSLIPPPPPPDPPVPLPQRQVDVMGDFSKSKPGQQVPYNTFISFVEPYTRAFGDDDIAYLCQKSDDLTPFLIPSLGKYYLDAWMEADPSKDMSNIGVPPPQLQRFKTADLKEDKLSTEHVFAGPLGERLLSALAPSSLRNLQIEHSQALSSSSPNPSSGQEDGTSAGDSSAESKAVNGADESQHESSNAMALDTSQPLNDAQAEAGPSSSTSPSTTQPDGIEMEDRLRRELRFLGVFPQNDPSGAIRSREGDVQWALRADDDISASLRACQRQLSEQINLNECRKARLATAVRARMARQEFEGLREMLDKQIEAGWQKRQKTAKKAAAASSSTQAKPATTLRGAAAAAAAAASTPGRAGSEDPLHNRFGGGGGKATLPEQLLGSLDKRARLADGFRPLFDAEPGRFHGIPPQTIHGDDPAQGAVPQDVVGVARAREESVEQGQTEHGLHALPDSVQIPASITISS